MENTGPQSSNNKQIEKKTSTNSIISFLLKQDNYPHTVRNLQHIETHISHVFLTGEFAYKLKKPVCYDFLDYSTVQQRKYFCQREVERNKRFAPHIYLDVVTISRTNGKIIFGQGETALDYLVKMHQFDNENLFTTLLNKDNLTGDLLKQLTDAVARFHNRTPVVRGFWNTQKIESFFYDNLQVCARRIPSFNSSLTLERLRKRIVKTLDTNRQLIEKRSKTHTKSVHGDLHLGNICIYQGKPQPFDGIEFNDQYANCDVWADIAFLIMDLHFCEHSRLARLVRNRYVERSDDYEGLALLPLYIAYRASVRAKVSALAFRYEAKERSIQLLKLANAALHPLKQAQLIVFGGLSGSGKSTIAQHLALKLDAVLVRSDAVRKHLLDLPLEKTAPAEAYQIEQNTKTYCEILRRAKNSLSCGYSVILDAVYLTKKQRDDVETFARKHNVLFKPLWCHVDVKVAKERILKRKSAISDATSTVLDKQFAAWEGLHTITWPILTTDNSLKRTLESAEQLLSDHYESASC